MHAFHPAPWRAVRRALFAIVTAGALGACAMPEPWVTPYERERLSDPVMQFQRDIPPLLTQARGNLTGSARDLWLTGTGTMQTQVADLQRLAQRTATAGAPLQAAVADATAATRTFVQWLEAQAPSKTGPSGIGKEQYTWSLRNVHLVPMSWDDEVVLLRRELDRAHASLKLEEQRNRALPPLTLVRNQEEFAARADAGVTKFMAFLKNTPVLTVQDYLEPALPRSRCPP